MMLIHCRKIMGVTTIWGGTQCAFTKNCFIGQFPQVGTIIVSCMHSSNKSRMVRCFTFVEPNMKPLYDTKKLK